MLSCKIFATLLDPHLFHFVYFVMCSFPTPGKDKACEEGTVEILARLLSDDSIQVKSQACAALMVYVILLFLLFSIWSQ